MIPSASLMVSAALRAPSLWAVLSLGYVSAGAAMAWHLGRLGHAAGTTSASLVVWPLLLGLVGRPPTTNAIELGRRPSRTPGPNAAAIEGAVNSLRRALVEDAHEDGSLQGGRPLLDADQLGSLAAALGRADRRIARVDRLLAEIETEGFTASPAPATRRGPEAAQLDTALTELRAARAHAQAELDAVLAGLTSLRLQLGMFALAGEVEPVRERLAEFEARVAALAELSSIELAQVRS